MTNVKSYSEKVLEHFKNPHNYGKMKNPSAIGEVGNIVCGDVMYLYIKVGKNSKQKEIIKDIKFETYGCAAAIATSSVITDLVKGKSIDEALKINKDNVIKSLEGLPPIKIHCSLLAVDALKEAIYNFLVKEKRSIPEELLSVHEKNKKEREFVEDKHSNWVEAEKEKV
ncbi:MAG: iron-sulfur cluster assembly scaffold protein [Candidatus Levybacteria bacterium CG_4_9_14_3_um_filter_35_16]|nr:MAG: iron-sulfur cluster assembly scaffold protein [Candidatus Levybacteria bacterium CG22_combo_CG10-13_8_21_14_all_35_11]PIZ98421.1 MAG: iron-sulfur cluster assembly scaffold protein [Candidatus Levybacteria bacterium CG_4_10_14_0_2_um_filter_35_8]PJA91573.1 MAG: iron-sulfur cluster assembly scaffold protein [Candidatus Levybacteria bacterium CG_4_9_14_3_um_filter_35_16]PJC54597.1 MAG: iron-sulfur cluster assembly scaffold protein [Candidatus Levybacteria bacterium CG_4_9_14_0_2_um_filter_3